MIEAVEMLRTLAGLMFWALTDLVLGAIWCGIIGCLVIYTVKGMK